MKYFLTIAAADNSGGAGIQQDIKVAWDLGYWPLSAITGLTVQNFTRALRIEPVDSKLLYEQIAHCLKDFPVSAVKIGAMTGQANMRIIIRALKEFRPKIVVLDPVIATSSSMPFMPAEAIDELVSSLVPLVAVVTPNAVEFAMMAGVEINSFEQAVEVAQKKAEQWQTTIILKGGHFNDKLVREAIVSRDSVMTFEHERRDFSKYSHGTGCTFSSALACQMASGLPIEQAYSKATEYLVNFYTRMQREV